MKLRKLGSHTRVLISAAELNTFADSWPCSGMRCATSGMSFRFESNGDLVDITGQRKSYDESAVQALSQDAAKFAGL